MNLRPATQADQKTIERIIRAAGINPMALDWRRFLIAEDNGTIVGIGQVKQHGDGSRELASIAVIPERREQGIASTIIRALLEKEPGEVYLLCRNELESFYARFGFRKIGRDEMTPYFRRITRVLDFLARWTGRRGIVMKRNADRRPKREDG
jgi:N-acetylglutamate synthase-like GNAT family acetyltransferase